MKTLYLLRHGHAETKQKQPDEERNLDQTGRKEALLTGEKMLKETLRPDIILSSHANRAYQTAQIVAETLAYPIKNIAIEKEIYYTDQEALLDIIKRQDNTNNSLMIAGHNPTITYVAQILSKNQKHEMPTAGLLVLECATPTWEDILKYDIKELLFFEPDTSIK
ncbi:MAG: hypothetical protein EOP53_01870 [Sphingobacteriales bacterium]|nr:MAG: hypothetical protein EOP53_01870 [Sphingobacteriales bacterium]